MIGVCISLKKSYKSLKNGYFPVNYFIVLLPTNYLFNEMQISEYDITNEIGEHSYWIIDRANGYNFERGPL